MTLREPYWMDCFSPSTRRACLANRDGTHWQEGQSFVGNFPYGGNNADVMALRQVFGWFLSCNKPRLRERWRIDRVVAARDLTGRRSSTDC